MTADVSVVELDTDTQGVEGSLLIEEYRQGVFTLTVDGDPDEDAEGRVQVPMSLIELRALHDQLSALLSAVEA